jgi:thioredoxin-like negative regulator of GroEL
MKSDKTILWIFGGLAGALGLIFFLSDLPVGFFSGTPARPVPGKVYELTSSNLAIARRAPVLVALFTAAGNADGFRMARSLPSLAQQVKDRAIVAVGNLDSEPELASKAGVKDLPAWVVYRDGNEVCRATGRNADLSVSRFIKEQTGKAP